MAKKIYVEVLCNELSISEGQRKCLFPREFFLMKLQKLQFAEAKENIQKIPVDT